jgi:plastocyanin
MRRGAGASAGTGAAAAAVAAALVVALAGGAAAADKAGVELVIKDHRFDPAEAKVPARQPLQIVVRNQDSTPEEFESPALKVEKVIPPGGSITVHVRPLEPGRYKFVGEYHEDTASGTLVAE